MCLLWAPCHTIQEWWIDQQEGGVLLCDSSDWFELPSLNQPFLPGASWWSPSWLHLSAAERPAMLMNFLPELSNASRARGFFSKNNIRDGLVGRFPSKQWGYFMASQLNTWNCWSGIYWIISRPMFGWFFLWVWKLWWDDEAGWTRNGGGGAGIQTNGVWSFFRVVNLEENFLINSWEGPPQMLGSWVVPPFSSVSSVANWLRWSRCLHRLFWRSST